MNITFEVFLSKVKPRSFLLETNGCPQLSAILVTCKEEAERHLEVYVNSLQGSFRVLASIENGLPSIEAHYEVRLPMFVGPRNYYESYTEVVLLKHDFPERYKNFSIYSFLLNDRRHYYLDYARHSVFLSKQDIDLVLQEAF